jgi:hypothetical protein
MKKTAVVVALAALFLGPSLALAAGVPGATVSLVCTDPVICEDPAAPVTAPLPVTTDAAGAFSFEGLAAAPWRLVVVVNDALDPTLVLKSAQIDFAVTADQTPAKLAGDVTTLDGADVSLQVNAEINEPDTAGIVLRPGYPKVQPAWNLNWLHSNGKLAVRLAGSGLADLSEVTLSSATGSITTTQIGFDPLLGEYRAVFAKRAAFAALVPADAVRGDVIPIAVGLTNAVGTDSFDASFRIVGPRKRHF